MSFNFCHPAFIPKIHSSAVTIDGYEVTNLISPSHVRLNKGFMVESFIKPPVSITLEFPVNIAISKVVVGTTVGSQRSCGIEIYAHSQKRKTSCLFDAPNIEQSTNQASTHSLSNITDSDMQRVYGCLGRGMDNQAHYFCFTNSFFQERNQFAHISKMEGRFVPPDNDGNVKSVFLGAKNHNHLNCLSHLVLRITRAAHGNTCAIKWLEVWGLPALSCPPDWVLRLLELHKQIIDPAEAKPGPSEVLKTSSDISQEHDKSPDLNVSEEQLPEDFLDPLTQEMMTMPVLLPCGKTINQCSLDKHVQEQARWGQPPSDPFTGKLFTTHDKPIPNAYLKVRLDQFLLRNPTLSKKYDTRVGRKELTSTIMKGASESTLITGSSSSKCNILNSAEIGMKRGVKRKQLSDHKDDMAFKSKRTSSEQGAENEMTLKFKSERVYNISGEPSTYVINSIVPSTNSVQHVQVDGVNSVSRLNCNEHSQRSSQGTDLDSLMQTTLAGLPSFLNKTSNKSTSDLSLNISAETECVQCQRVDQLYRLSCKHLYCRDCLLSQKAPEGCKIQKSEVWCCVCEQIMNKNEAVKVHL